MAGFSSLLLFDFLKHVCTCWSFVLTICPVGTYDSCYYFFFFKGFLWLVIFQLGLNLVLKSHTQSLRAHHLVFWMHLHRYVWPAVVRFVFLLFLGFQSIISIHTLVTTFRWFDLVAQHTVCPSLICWRTGSDSALNNSLSHTIIFNCRCSGSFLLSSKGSSQHITTHSAETFSCVPGSSLGLCWQVAFLFTPFLLISIVGEQH